VPGAVNLPHAKISEETLRGWPPHTTFIVYCAGPHCNGADRAAARLARLNRRTKIMIGGVAGWLDENFKLSVESGPTSS
jgi:rhodanese-related sulfurtransferase